MSTHNIAVVMTGNATSLRGALVAAGRDVGAFSKQVQSAGATSSKTASMLSMGLKAAVVAVGIAMAYSVAQAIAFDRAMRNVQSITKQSDASLAATAKTLISMSTRLPQSAKTLAEGLYNIASSGFQGADGLKVLEAAATAASAGLTTTDVAAKGITAVLNAYGLSADKAADVSDVLFQTVNVGVLTFEELASELGDVVGLASVLTVGIDEVGSAIAAMTLNGINAAESTTALNRTMQALSDPSDELAAGLKSVGYESGVQALKVDSLSTVMEKLRVASGGNIEVLQKWFPEIRAMKGALALMGAQGQTYQRTVAAIENTEARAGATRAALNEQLKSFGAQWDIFKNKINAAAITMGMKMLPTLKGALDATVRLAKLGFAPLAAAAGMLRPFWNSIVAIGGDLVAIFGELADAVGPTVGALAGLAAMGIIQALNALGAGIEAVTGFLREHEGIVKVIALLWTIDMVQGFLTSAKAARMFTAAMTGMRTSALAGFAVELASRLKMVAVGLGQIAMQGGSVTGGLKTMSGAFQGMTLAGTALSAGIGLVVAETVAMVQGFKNAKDNAHDFIEEATRDIPLNSQADIRDSIQTLGDEIDVQRQKLEGYNSAWGGLRGVVELITPMENGLLDAAVAVDEYGSAIDDLEVKDQRIGAVSHMIGRQLGVTAGEVQRYARQVGIDLSTLNSIKPDPAKLEEFTAEIGKAVLLGDQSPRIAKIGEGMGAVASAASSGTEAVDGFKTALDGLLGIPADVFSATTAMQQGIDDLVASLKESGPAWDVNTNSISVFGEKAQATRDDLIGATEDAKSLAEALAVRDGPAAGVTSLTNYRNELHRVLSDANYTEEQIRALFDQLGLAPDDIEILMQLAGKDEAQAGIDALIAGVSDLDTKTARPTIDLKTDLYNSKSDAVLFQLGILDGTKVSPTIDPDTQPAENDIADVVTGLTGLPDVTPTVRIAGHPEATLENVLRKLNQINGSVVGATVQVKTAGQYPGLFGLPKTNQRWGGLHAYAAGGITPAHITSNELIKYGEPETGGEAFVPRRGNPTRSMGVLSAAASWYGARVVPMASGGYVGTAAANVGARNALAQDFMSTPVGAAALWASGGKADEAVRSLRTVADLYLQIVKEMGEASAHELLWMSKTTEDFQDLAQAALDAKEAEQAAKEAAAAIAADHMRLNDVRHEVGVISDTAYLAILNKRLGMARKYSDEWLAIWNQIQDLTAQMAEKDKAILEEHNAKIEQLVSDLANVYTTAQSKFLSQRETYDDAVRARNERVIRETKAFRDDIVSTYRDLSNPVSLFGGDKNVSSAEIIRALKHRVKAAAQFGETYKLLVARGLDKTVLTQIAQGGPENLSLAQALLKVDPALVNQAMASTGAVGAGVADIALQWERSRIQQQVYADITLPTMKTFQQLLNEEVALWKDKQKQQDVAEAWARRMANEVNPALTKSYRDLASAIQAAGGGGGGGGGATSGGTGLTGAALEAARATNAANNQAIFDRISAIRQQLMSAQSYDVGGFLQPGYTMAYNGTGAPERVGGPLVTVGAGAVTITATGSSVDTSTMQQMVDDGFRQLARSIERKVRR